MERKKGKKKTEEVTEAKGIVRKTKKKEVEIHVGMRLIGVRSQIPGDAFPSSLVVSFEDKYFLE